MHSAISEKSHTYSEYIALGLVIATMLIGLHLRLVSAGETIVINPIRADARDYYCYAQNLQTHGIYSRICVDNDTVPQPDALRTPGYPLLLTFFVTSPPTHQMLDTIVFAQAFISTLTLLAAYILYRILLKNIFLSALAALFTALSPHLIVANSYLLTETIFTFLLVFFILSLVLALKTKNILWLFLPGILLGLTSLVRPIMQFFPFAVLFFFLVQYGWKKGIAQALVLFIGFSLAYGPWIGRNINVFGKTGDDQLTINFLHHGLYPNFTYDSDPRSYGFPYRFDPRSSEIGSSIKSSLQEILRRFRDEPVGYAGWIFLGKPKAFWSWDIVQGQGDAFVYPVAATPYAERIQFRITHAFMYIFHPLILLLAFIGCFTAWIPSRTAIDNPQALLAAQFCSILLIYFTIVHMIGAPFPRYSVPLRPILYGMTMYGVWVASVYIAGHLRTWKRVTITDS